MGYIIVFLLGFCINTSTVNASLIKDGDWILDTYTGISWHQAHFIRSLAPSSLPEGWRYATWQEVDGLLGNYVTIYSGECNYYSSGVCSPNSYEAISSFISLFSGNRQRLNALYEISPSFAFAIMLTSEHGHIHLNQQMVNAPPYPPAVETNMMIVSTVVTPEPGTLILIMGVLVILVFRKFSSVFIRLRLDR